MIQIHGKTILSMEFKSKIKTHDNLFIQNPTHINNIKAQFSLVISNPDSHWQYQSPVLAGNI